MKNIFNRLRRKNTGVDFMIFNVEKIELTPLSQDFGTKTYTRTIRVRSAGSWSTITLFGKNRQSTKIEEVNTWE